MKGYPLGSKAVTLIGVFLGNAGQAAAVPLRIVAVQVSLEVGHPVLLNVIPPPPVLVYTSTYPYLGAKLALTS